MRERSSVPSNNRRREAATKDAASVVVASVTGDPMCYISAGAERQEPARGGVEAVLARA